jgi:hypothetical protein
MYSRNSITFLILAAIILISAAWAPANAVPRQCVILEGFTQWNCGPCANWNPSEDGVLTAMTRDTVIAVKYHGWWPGTNNDQFHLWNVAESTARINLYGVAAIGVPYQVVGGHPLNPQQSVSALRNTVRSRFAANCPCTIEIAALYTGATTVNYSGTVTAESDIIGLRLFVALITNEEHAPPQGSNGETVWYDVFRDMSPNATSGLSLTAGAGETQEFSGTLNCDAGWNANNMTVVAFVQNVSTDEIVQGENTVVEQNYGMALSSIETYQRMINPASGEQNYYLYIDHLGLLDDDYDVQLLGDFPEGWTHTIEATGVAANESEITVPLSYLETSQLTVRLNPNGNPGYVEFTVDVASPNEPLVHDNMSFRIMGGLDILVVDDDESGNFESYFMDAVTPYADSHDLALGIWDTNLDILDNSYFSTTDLIVWFTGNSFQSTHTISALDQLILGDFLSGGGRLLLSGQGIGLDIRLGQFWSNNLHLSPYVLPNPQGDLLEGYLEDPITDEMLISLDGGTGADNQTRQHRILPLDAQATPILRYVSDDDSMDCAVRVEDPNYRAVYFAFGLEGISDDQVRYDLMQNSLDWLYDFSAADDNPAPLPAEFALGQNFPNPFNPETVIPFTLAERSMVTLNVYDILGREVVQLVSGIQDAGMHSVNWNASHLSSGIYFYTLEAVSGNNTFRNTRKLVLMK